jgi:hypothetical protein
MDLQGIHRAYHPAEFAPAPESRLIFRILTWPGARSRGRGTGKPPESPLFPRRINLPRIS